jgi:hypothetical protein
MREYSDQILAERRIVNSMMLMSNADHNTFTAMPDHAPNDMVLVVKGGAIHHVICSLSIARGVGKSAYLAFSNEALFQQLLQRWHLERGASSSITQISMCRSYQRIIAMGRDVAVPLILQDLRKRDSDPDHWFWALQMLTGEDPVSPEARGDMRQMAHEWLNWGYRNGYAY